MRIVFTGVRGHYGYALSGLESTDIACEVVGICAGAPGDDLTPLKGWCAVHGHSPATFADPVRMFAECRPDMAVIAGPFESHAALATEAMERGIHVFCEKPLALSLTDLDALHQRYLQSKVHFAAMMGLRYDPAFYTAWRSVRDGAIGNVRLIETRKSYKLGSRPEYFKHRDTCGGIIPWVGSHAVDLIRWFSARDFVSVTASHSKKYNREHGDLEITAVCNFVLEDEVLATAAIDYCRPDSALTHGDDRIRVVGTSGVIEVARGTVELIDASGVHNLAPQCDRNIFGDFLRQIAGAGECLVSAEDSFLVTRACLLARESADIGGAALRF